MRQPEPGSSLRAALSNTNAMAAWLGSSPAKTTASTAVPSFAIPCQLVASASRCSAAPGSQLVEWSARGRARVGASSRRPGNPSPNARRALQGHMVAGAAVRFRSGSSRRGRRLLGLGSQIHRPVLARFLVCQGLCPNQSLEPTRVGKPPLAAQLQRCTAGLGKAK